YNAKNTGRPFDAANKYTSKYLDIANTPLYPFGYGLSYTKFELSNLQLDKLQILPTGNVKVKVDVANMGKRAGEEVVQLYIHDVAASVTRPVKELKGFQKVALKAGEKRTLEFTLTPEDLKFYDRDLKPTIENGEFQIYVGTSSDSGLQTSFEVVDKISAKPTTAQKIENEPADPAPTAPQATAQISKEDEAFLDDLQKKTFDFFWENSNPKNGLTLDRTGADGTRKSSTHPSYNIASSASTGFALSSYCVGATRGWVSPEQAKERTRNTLDFFANKAFNKNGWFYHWMDYETGERRWTSEISSIDTALLMGGVLTVKQCFADNKEIVNLADLIYKRIDFQWMLNGDPYLLSHGWRPENGFIANRWRDYSEDKMLYLLAIGSPTHPIPPQAWNAWERTWKEYGGYRYLAAVSPLFIHQFSHAYVDFRGRREHRPPYVDYFENSVKATRAQQKFFVEVLSKDFPKYSATIWGLTASDSEKGYIAWGAPPREPAIDGTVVPCAPAGSLMFAPDITLPTLKAMKDQYGDRVYKKYGFVDAFNPNGKWTDSDVIGIDLGITVASIENLRSGKIWYWFMQNDEIRRGLKRATIF
ncbi:MAG: glucoamylase family protein, partial [Pyrinomonadaceae bacterium]